MVEHFVQHNPPIGGDALMAYPEIIAPIKNRFYQNAPQYARITLNGVGETLVFSDQDIVEGGLSINRYCFSGSSLELGSVVAAELTLRLNNYSGDFNNVIFEGGELFVEVGVEFADEINYVPMGYFIVQGVPRNKSIIEINALDRMVLFDRYVENIPATGTVNSYLGWLCNAVGVTMPGLVECVNLGYAIDLPPIEEQITYRQVLSWLCEIMGVNAFMRWDGALQLRGFRSRTSEITITPSNRFESDLAENVITVTGVLCTYGKTAYQVGSSDYLLVIKDNPLLQANLSTVINNIYAAMAQYQYLPFTATTVPCPHLYPMDVVTIQDYDGNNIDTLISDITFTMNQSTKMAGKGLSEQEAGLSSPRGLTKQEAAIIAAATSQAQTAANTRITRLVAFNELICNSIGLYFTAVDQPNGSAIYYLHDQPELENSNTIFTVRDGGIAWTDDGWNSGSPVWQNGVTAAGDAFFRYLSAKGINVSDENNPYHIEITPDTFQIYYNDMLITSIVIDEMIIPKVKVTSQLRIGSVVFIPRTDGADVGYVTGE